MVIVINRPQKKIKIKKPHKKVHDMKVSLLSLTKSRQIRNIEIEIYLFFFTFKLIPVSNAIFFPIKFLADLHEF